MATARQFEDLALWQEARQLVGVICTASRQHAFNQDFGLRDQIRRAAVSTMSNIAEGFERGARKEFMQFLNVAKGSNGEFRSQLYAALEQRYISEKEFTALSETAVLPPRKLGAFIHYLESYVGNSGVRKPAGRQSENR
jgi:four helix bundle protein